MRRQPRELLGRQAAPEVLVFPGPDDIKLGHNLLLSTKRLATRTAPVARATAQSRDGSFEAPVLEIDGTGRMRRQPRELLGRQAAPEVLVFPGPDDIERRHKLFLSSEELKTSPTRRGCPAASAAGQTTRFVRASTSVSAKVGLQSDENTLLAGAQAQHLGQTGPLMTQDIPPSCGLQYSKIAISRRADRAP
jgi:hypothetical protein